MQRIAMHPLRTLLPACGRATLGSAAASLLFLAAGCGGGGGTSTGSTQPPASASTLDVVLASGAGTTANVSAVVDGVVLERADGTMTGNLLDASRSVTLVHPLAVPDALALANVPPGTYAAVHVAFRQGSGVLRGADGQSHAFAVPGVLRAGLDDGPATVGAGRSAWQFHHRVPAPVSASQGVPWSLDMGCSSGQSLAWDSVTVQVAAVDATNATVDVVWNGTNNGFPVQLVFDDNSILQSRSGALVDLTTFLGQLTPGGYVEVDGVLGADYHLLVRRAKPEDGPGSGSGSGGENKILGTITSTDRATSTLTVQVLEVERGTAIATGGTLPVLTVDASTAAIHRSSRSWVALPFPVLAVGDLVEVEWNGAVVNGAITAREVELEDASRGVGVGLHEVEGQVDSVDLSVGVIRMVPRRDDPIVFSGQTWPAARVQLDASTLLYLDRPSQQLDLSQVSPGMRIWVMGARSSGAVQGELELSGSRIRVRN